MECVGCNWEENLVEWKGEGKSVTVDMQNEKHDSCLAWKRRSCALQFDVEQKIFARRLKSVRCTYAL